MNVEIGTEDEQFLFWDYLFRIFVTVSLQCTLRCRGLVLLTYIYNHSHMKVILLLLFCSAKEQVFFDSNAVYLQLIFRKKYWIFMSSRMEVRVRLTSLLQRYVKRIFMLSTVIMSICTINHVYTDKKENKFSSYIRKFRRDRVQRHIWRTASPYMTKCAFPHILGSPSSYMTLHPIHSEFPHIWGNIFFFFFISAVYVHGFWCF